jgi:hypothetical protein
MEKSAKRGVAVCLVGFDHGRVESEVTKKLSSSRRHGEVVFQESRYREPYDESPPTGISTGHWGCERRFFANMTFVFSMISAFITRSEDELLYGHGGVLEDMSREFVTGKHQNISLWYSLSVVDKLIYTFSYEFFHAICSVVKARGQDALRGEAIAYFDGSEQIATKFLLLASDCVNRLTFTDCGATLGEDTMRVLNEFVTNFMDLLLERKEDLGPELREAANLLLDFIDDPSRGEAHGRKIVLQAALLRDRENWRWMEAFVGTNEQITGIIITMGRTHLLELYRLIASHNISVVNMKDRRGSIFYPNVAMIAPPYPRTSAEYLVTQKERGLVWARQVLEKVDHWRGLNAPFMEA